MAAPGRLLHRFAGWCCPSECERVIEPLLADLQREWLDASGQPRGRRLLRGYVAFWQALSLCLARLIAREAVTPPSAEFSATAGIAFGAAMAGAIVMELVLLFYRWTNGDMMPSAGLFVLWLVTNALVTAVPVAILPAFLHVRGHMTGAAAKDAIKLAVAGVALTGVLAGWLGPMLFAEYGPGLIARREQKPVTETLRTNVLKSPDAQSWPVLLRSRDVPPERRQQELRRRAQLVALVAIFAVAGWALGALGRARARQAGMWWLAAWFATFLGSHSRDWIPIAVFILGAIAVGLRWRSRPQALT